jgi:hypothetical protein
MDIYKSKQETAKINKENERLYKRQIKDLRKVLKTPEGRRTMWWLLTVTAIFNNGFNDNPYQNAFKDGLKFVGQEAFDRITKADPGAFSQMQHEYASEQESKKALKLKKEDK